MRSDSIQVLTPHEGVTQTPDEISSSAVNDVQPAILPLPAAGRFRWMVLLLVFVVITSTAW